MSWMSSSRTKRFLMIAGVVVLVLALAGVSVALGLERSRGDSATAASGSETTVAGGGTSGSSETTEVSGAGPSAVEPQPEGVELQPVQNPPQHTLAYIDADQYSANADYEITFVPYGTSARPHTLIIQILTSSPQGKVERPFDFAGMNVMVDTSLLPADMAVGEGGTYKGTLRLVKQQSGLAQGGVLAPMLMEASAKE